MLSLLYAVYISTLSWFSVYAQNNYKADFFSMYHCEYDISNSCLSGCVHLPFSAILTWQYFIIFSYLYSFLCSSWIIWLLENILMKSRISEYLSMSRISYRQVYSRESSFCWKSICIEFRMLLGLVKWQSNKLHLFTVTQHRFNLFQIVPLYVCVVHVSACRLSSACQYKNLIKEDIIKSKGPPVYSHYFFNNVKLRI